MLTESQLFGYESHWPGNVRDLRNVIRRIIVQGESEENIIEIIRNTAEGRHAPQSFSAEKISDLFF